MKHFATPSFWETYYLLPDEIQKLASRSYKLLKANPSHPSLHFKKVAIYRSVRIGLHHRALGVDHLEGVLWFWIGTHDEYQKMIRK